MASRPATSNTSNGTVNGNNFAEGQAQSSTVSRTSNRSNGTVADRNPTRIQSSAVQRTSNTSSGAIDGNNSSEGQGQPSAPALPHASNASNETTSDNNPAERRTRPSAESGPSTTSTAHANDSNVASGEGSRLEQLAAQAAAARENNGEGTLTEEELINARRQEIDRVNGLGTNEDGGVFEQYCVQIQEELQDAHGTISLLVHPDKQPDGEWKEKATRAQQILNRVYNQLKPTLPLRAEYQPSHDDDGNPIEPNPTEPQSSHGADGNQIESNAVKQPSITEGGEHATPHSANQPSVVDDDHNMVDAANQPSVVEDDHNMVDAANQPPVAEGDVQISGLAEDLSNLCVTDDGEPIFAKRHVFKNFHFLIREQSGSYVWRSCEEADEEKIGLVVKPTKEFIKDRKRQYKGMLWVAMAVDKAIVYPICPYPQISIMAEWRDGAPPTLMWRGELNKIAGKERVDKDLLRSLPFRDEGVHQGRKYVVASETEVGLDLGKAKAIAQINKENQLGVMAQASVQQAAAQPVATQPAAPQPAAPKPAVAQPVAPLPAAPLPALAQPAPTQARPAQLPAIAQPAPFRPAPFRPAPVQPAAQPAAQPTFAQLPAPGQPNEILQSSDFQQMLTTMIAQALTQVQTQPAPIQPLAVQQQQQQPA